MKEKNTPATPMLRQYFEIKAHYPEAILLYRVGDFYETYGEDALTASRVLGIVLTRKSAGNGRFIEMAGIPYHAIDNYLPKLVNAGYKAAVCDQLEDPKLTKKLVRRGVTELITPGVAYNDNLLKSGENNWLAALHFSGKDVGMAFLDISTGAFKVAQGSLDYADVLLGTMTPREILLERTFVDGFRQRFGQRACLTPLDAWAFAAEPAFNKLCHQLGVSSLKGFGIDGLPLAVSAAGAVLCYLEMTQHSALGHIRTVSRLDEGDYVWMDRFTLRNLEVFQSLAGAEGRSLIDIINQCVSPMGTRLLREWLALPLKDIARLNERYDIVDAFKADTPLLTVVRDELACVGDLERIVAKAAAGKLLPREALQLARALRSTAAIHASIAQPAFQRECEALSDCSELYDRITRTLLPEAAAALGKGDVIAAGVSPELDIPEQKLEVRGIGLGFEMPEISILKSAPGQTLSFKSVKYDRIETGAGLATFRMEAPDTWQVENARLDWCNGHIRLGGITYRIGQTTTEAVLYCDRLEMPIFLTQIGLGQINGSGSINGTIPVVLVQKTDALGKSKIDNIYFEDAFLFSTPGENGVIKGDLDEALTNAATGIEMELAKDALKDFTYSWVRMRLQSVGPEKENMKLELSLDGRPNRALYYAFDENTASFIKSPTPCVFQGIHLDTNVNMYGKAMELADYFQKIFSRAE